LSDGRRNKELVAKGGEEETGGRGEKGTGIEKSVGRRKQGTRAEIKKCVKTRGSVVGDHSWNRGGEGEGFGKGNHERNL